MVVSMQTAFHRTSSSVPWRMPRGGTSSAGPSAADEGVAELAGHYAMSFAAVQKHVAILERAGLVSKERWAAARSSALTSSRLRMRVACSTGTRSCGGAGSTA